MHCLLKLPLFRLFPLGSLASARLNFPPLSLINRQIEIRNKFLRRVIMRAVKKLGGKVDDITFFLTAEANKILIDLHAWTPVVMKRTAHHALPVHLVTVMLGNVSRTNLCFDFLIDSHLHHILSGPICSRFKNQT